MVQTRKKSNLRPSQEEHKRRRKQHVFDALVSLLSKKKPRVFADVTELSVTVADMVSIAEAKAGESDKPCANTTLLRNKRDGTMNPYRPLLDAYMDGTFDPEKPEGKKLTAKDVEAYIRQYPALRAFIAQKDLRVANLEDELETKTKQLEQLHQQILEMPSDALQLTDEATKARRDALRQAQDGLAMTVTWVRRFCEEFQWLDIDMEAELILNKAARNKPVAEKSMLEPFFRCLKTSVPKGIDHEEI